MKQVIPFLLLSIIGCSKIKQRNSGTTVDVESLPTCSKQEIKAEDKWEKFKADSGDLLYASKKTGKMCWVRLISK